MFPKISKKTENNIFKVHVQYLTDSVGLEIDENVCQGCGICMKVCPNDAIKRGPIGYSKKFAYSENIPTSLDAKACSYCGLCSYMCPWNAITLIIDDEPVALEDLQIVKKQAVPQLDYEMKKCKEGVKDAKAYLEGDITFTTSNCAGGCNTCIDVCPTGALTMKKPEKPWDKGREIVVDKDKCILCGTCTNACPVFDAIKLEITNVKSKGKSNPVFWDRVVENLKISRMREGRKIN